MKKAFYLFISVLLILFSLNKVNDSRTIKRTNEQTNKQEIILIYSSNDFYTTSLQVGNQTQILKIATTTFKVSTRRRYLVALRTNKNETIISDYVDLQLCGFDPSLNLTSGEQVYNYVMSHDFQYRRALSYYTKQSSYEGGYLTYYLSLLDYGNIHNYDEMIISITQNGISDNLSYFVQDIYVYDSSNSTTPGETWYNYPGGGAADPSEIQTAYDKGYSDAIKSGTGLNWLQSAFNMITNILNIELLPNIKLAYLVAIPLLIELILFVLRFIK